MRRKPAGMGFVRGLIFKGPVNSVWVCGNHILSTRGASITGFRRLSTADYNSDPRCRFCAGTHLGSYEIVSALGAAAWERSTARHDSARLIIFRLCVYSDYAYARALAQFC